MQCYSDSARLDLTIYGGCDDDDWVDVGKSAVRMNDAVTGVVVMVEVYALVVDVDKIVADRWYDPCVMQEERSMRQV